MPPYLGFYGSPVLLWDKGLSLPEVGANTVVVGHGSVTPDMVERCHNEGAKIFADFSLFVGDQIAEQHPELWPIGADGKRLEKEDWYLGLCPTYAWYKEKKLAEIRDFLLQTPVDGVYLDFIRWPCHWEVPHPRIEQSCFCDNALATFSQEKGLKVYGHTTRQKARYILLNYRSEWTAWKAAEITTFVAQIKDVVKEARPHGLLGIFGVPWKPEEHDNAITEVIGQDFPALAEYVDLFSPMVYHAMCDKEMAWVRGYSDWLAARTGRPVWPIIQATNDQRPVPAPEFGEVLHQALLPPTNGVLVFTLEGLLQEPEKLEIAREAFHQSPGKEGPQ